MPSKIKAIGFDFGGVIERAPLFLHQELNRELTAFIPALKQQGFKIGILSNYAIDLTDKLTAYQIYHLFDVVITPFEIEYEKPDPKAFAILFERLGVCLKKQSL